MPLDSQLLMHTIVAVPGDTLADRAAAISALEAQKNTEMLSNMTIRMYKIEDQVGKLTQQYEQANKLQEQNNEILQQQVEQLKKQAEDLKKENELQAIELRKEKIFKWVSFGISTAIAVLALCVSIIGLLF